MGLNIRHSILAAPPPPAGITHGRELTLAMVGPSAIGAGSMRSMAAILPPRGYFRGDSPLEFCLSTPYVYNNNPTNFGGIVPSGGLVIDGYAIPAGTYVMQFCDFSNTDIYITQSDLLFRGCKSRCVSTGIGVFNCAAVYTGRIFVFYSEFGSTGGTAPADTYVIAAKIAAGTQAVMYRNYASRVGAGFQINLLSGGEVVENYVHDMTTFGGDYHINGHTSNGGESCMLIKRNNIVNWPVDSSGRSIAQTDCTSFFQDFGDFPGNGTNRDGTTGYIIDSNYLGGTGYCIYAGMNAGKPTTSVHNMKVTNNLITTVSFPNGGAQGPISAVPPWDVQGNFKSNNLWADGPNAGTAAF